MIKKELSKSIILYQFEPLPGKHFSDSIVALLSGNKAILIDTGYEIEGAMAYEDINR